MYQLRLNQTLSRIRSKCLGQEARFSDLLPGGACQDEEQYAHRVAQVLTLQVARVSPERWEDICRGYRWTHAAALFLIHSSPTGDHTLRNLIRLARLDRSVREMLDFTHFPKRYVSTFLTAPPHIAAGLEQAAWSMAESAEERLNKLEDLCGKL